MQPDPVGPALLPSPDSSVVHTGCGLWHLRVMLQQQNDAMHVQPPLPEVCIHGKDWFPVGGELRVAGVRPAVLQGQYLEERGLLLSGATGLADAGSEQTGYSDLDLRDSKCL